VELDFVKMHGLGNDFVVIEDLDSALDLAEEAVVWLCDRNFGIGADGLMLVRRASGPHADFAWWFRNSDGSEAEMCGNGIRCLVKYVIDRGLVPADKDCVRVETVVGVKECRAERDDDGKMLAATVDMGEPIVEPSLIPTTLSCEDAGNPVIACGLPTEYGEVPLTCISMGNPHAVLFVDDVDSAPVETLGPVIENDPAFPKKTNVEFVEVHEHEEFLKIRVWERGVGETLACGTGACAAAVAAILNCLAGRDLTVELPGGELQVRWAQDGHVYMTGPAREVFSGTVSVAEEG
jgi:diaminopimelate epimerase